ncbi:MAG: molybdenum cofactor biosynthesis protein B [Nitrospiria bacterium]
MSRQVMISVGVLTISDKGAAGRREDESGRLLHELVEKLPGKVVVYRIVPDERTAIRETLISFSDEWHANLVLTTGGTGISPRDVTPEVTEKVIDYPIPGMAEIMRMEGYKINPRAIISRAVAGVRGKTLIVNFPGSPRAVRENFEMLLPVFPHAIEKMLGEAGDCG